MSRGPILRVLKYLSDNWFLAIGAFAALLISSGSNLVVPRLMQGVIDRGIIEANFKAILYGVIIITAVAVIRAVFTFLQGYWGVKLSQNVAYHLRNKLYGHIQNLSFSYHDKAQTGQLLTRVTNDVELVKGLGVSIVNNHIAVDKAMKTNIPGLFAAGDVTDNVLKQDITAVAEGAVSAFSAYQYLKGITGSH